jgi:hypothetical protein
MTRIVVVALIIVAYAVAPAAGDPLSDCLATAGTQSARVRCYLSATGHSGGSSSSGSNDASTYEFLWLPSCDHATPGTSGAESMSCSAMLTCDPPSIRLALWSHRVTDASGDPTNDPWTYGHSECRDPGDVGATLRSISWRDVVSAIRKVGVPTAEVSAPGYTLVNLETTFYTDPQQFTRTLSIIGYTVDVEVTPTTYTWHWGQGETTTTDTPGRPYPSTDVTHTFVRHTPKGHPLNVSVDVGWVARYRVDGGAWINIPETITVPGPATTIPVRQASAVLVEGR